MHPMYSPRCRRAAFTLLEVLVAATITGITIALLLPFFVFSLRSIFHGEQKLLINGDIRNLTNAMMENARESNYFVLYKGFHAFSYLRDMNGDGRRDSADRDAGGEVSATRDANADNASTELDRQLGGATGDFLVLVFTRNNAIFDSRFYDNIIGNEPSTLTEVTRLVAYWIAPNRNPAAQGESTDRIALYSFDTDRFRPSASSTSWTTPWGVTFPIALGAVTSLENLLPDATTAAATASYADILVNDLDGRTAGWNHFLNFGNKTAVMQSRVLHGNRAKRVTNTYNFAITPRG